MKAIADELPHAHVVRLPGEPRQSRDGTRRRLMHAAMASAVRELRTTNNRQIAGVAADPDAPIRAA